MNARKPKTPFSFLEDFRYLSSGSYDYRQHKFTSTYLNKFLFCLKKWEKLYISVIFFVIRNAYEMVDLNLLKCYWHSHVVPLDISSWIRSYFTERTLKFGSDYSSNIGLRLTKSYHFNWQLISGQKHRTQISTHYLTQYPHKPFPPSNVGLKIITKKVMIAWNEEYQHNSLLTSFSEFHPTPGSVHLT